MIKLEQHRTSVYLSIIQFEMDNLIVYIYMRPLRHRHRQDEEFVISSIF